MPTRYDDRGGDDRGGGYDRDDRRRDDRDDRRGSDRDYNQGDYSSRRSDYDERRDDRDRRQDDRRSDYREPYDAPRRSERRDSRDRNDYSSRRSDNRREERRDDDRDRGGRYGGRSDRRDDDRRDDRGGGGGRDDRGYDDDGGRDRKRSKWDDGNSPGQQGETALAVPQQPPGGGGGGDQLPDWLADLQPGAAPQPPPMQQPVMRLNCKTLWVKSHFRGGLIGTKGAFINEIRSKTGCTIQLNNSAPEDPEFAVQITGNVEQVEAMINERLASLSKPGRDYNDVPQQKHQWLIDKMTAEGTPPERIAALIAKLPP